MGFIKIVAALPIHIKAIIITIIGLTGLWMAITPIYLEVLSWSSAMPSWGWMIIGVVLILFAAKFGKAVL